MKLTYHFHLVANTGNQADGIVSANTPLSEPGAYTRLREAIGEAQGLLSEDFTLTSLSLVHTEP